VEARERERERPVSESSVRILQEELRSFMKSLRGSKRVLPGQKRYLLCGAAPLEAWSAGLQHKERNYVTIQPHCALLQNTECLVLYIKRDALQRAIFVQLMFQKSKVLWDCIALQAITLQSFQRATLVVGRPDCVHVSFYFILFLFILSGVRLSLLVLRPLLTYCTSPG
jgi:hypothetical protein